MLYGIGLQTSIPKPIHNIFPPTWELIDKIVPTKPIGNPETRSATLETLVAPWSACQVYIEAYLKQRENWLVD